MVVLDRKAPVEQILTHPPVAVFEILSSEDQMTRVMRKLEDYAGMGVRNIFLIDPKARIAYRFAQGNLDRCRWEKESLDGSIAEIDWPMVIERLT